MTRIAYIDCIGGLAGDMLLAALLDAGSPRHVLDDTVAALGISGVEVETERVARQGVTATAVRIIVREPRTSRPASVLREIVSSAHELSAQVRGKALDALDRLAEAESAIHGVAVGEVHLHELGGVDTLVDLCGAFALLDALGVDGVTCSPLPFSRGTIATDHGVIPSPAPAVTRLLTGARFVGVDGSTESVTPTGAAVVAVAADAYGELPEMTLERVGYGAGGRDTADRPNVIRLLVGQATRGGFAGSGVQTTGVVVLEATIDDLLPQLVPDALERARHAGAIDTWVTPVQMKKGRPGFVISALSRSADEQAVAAALLEHTSTLGVRVAPMRRYELEREIREVTVFGSPIRVKVGLLHDRVVNIAPEHDDCAAVAAGVGRSVKEVWSAALVAATQPAGRAT